MLHWSKYFYRIWLLERKFVYRNIKGKLQPYSQFIANDSNGKGILAKSKNKKLKMIAGGILITPRGRRSI